MPKKRFPRKQPSRRLACEGVEFAEVEIPRSIRPRLVVRFAEGLSLLVEDRVEQAEEKLAAAEREIERKDQIIAALRKRLFGSQSERIDPDQYQLEFGEDVLGKPEPPTPCESEGDPEEEDGEKRNAEPRRRNPD